MGFKAAAQTVIVAGMLIACSVCAFREHQKPTLVTLWNDSRNLIPKGTTDETETGYNAAEPPVTWSEAMTYWKKHGSTILHDDGDDPIDAFGWSNGANRTDELYGYMYDRLPAWRVDWEPLVSVDPDLIYFVQNWNVDEQ